LQDIEVVKMTEDARSLLEAILNSTEDAISVVDENGYGILINPAYTRITGLTEQDVINKPCTVDIAEGESVHMQVLSTKKAVRGISMKVGPNKRPVIVNVAPIMINNELKGSVGVIHDISEIRKLTEELENAKSLIRLMTSKYTFADIIGEGELIKTAIAQAKHAADTPATVLLRGESGTGKELFAHAMHNASSRRDGPFVRVNCAAIAETLQESELFGYVEGAFTGAVKGGRKGYFEEAHGGTIFLDEIGDVNLSVQAKLLRVLQEKEVVRVGGNKPIPINVRVIAATNANLEQRIAEERFREDLYYRVNVFPIFVPPLRGRKEDIPTLTAHFCKKLGREFGRKAAEISPEVIELLMRYDWPGNVRELENVIGRAIISMNYNEEIILPQYVPPLGNSRIKWPNSQLENKGLMLNLDGTLDEIMDAVEKSLLQKTLKQTNGNKTMAAKLLGIAIRSLYNKLEKHKLLILSFALLKYEYGVFIHGIKGVLA
jgi:PAS domain S-box-containing protein